MNDTISLELHRAVVAQHSRSESDLLTTNAALAQRVTELESALDKAADDIAFLRNFFEIQSKQYADKQIAAEEDAARLRAALERVEFVSDDVCTYCPWCNADDRDREPGVDMDYIVQHKPDCSRQAALAQTAQTEVKA